MVCSCDLLLLYSVFSLLPFQASPWSYSSQGCGGRSSLSFVLRHGRSPQSYRGPYCLDSITYLFYFFLGLNFCGQLLLCFCLESVSGLLFCHPWVLIFSRHVQVEVLGIRGVLDLRIFFVLFQGVYIEPVVEHPLVQKSNI